jgi:Nuclease-related domain
MLQGRSVRERVAGQSAMCTVVEAQARVRPRGPVARLFGASPLDPAIRPQYRVALAELKVGDMLENLGQRWDVLHDIPLGDTVLDHLSIGPAGIFAVVAANFRDEDVVIDGENLLVSNESRDDIARTASQADAAAAHLTQAAGKPIRVQPLLVVVDPRRIVVKIPPATVRIVSSGDLERLLTRGPVIVSGDDVAALSDLADLESTWPVPPGTEHNHQRLHAEFALVRHEVSSALVRRVLWGVIAFTLAYGIVWGLVATLVSSVVLP